jgi:hypothetical protein
MACGLAATLISGAATAARADWTVLGDVREGPVRGMTRRADGRLLGARLDGRAVAVVLSNAKGERWRRLSTVAADATAAFGDPTVLAVPATHTVFCAFRTHTVDGWRVRVYRSDNDGRDWAADGVVAGPDPLFLGAPFLFLRANGDLQCYFDSEPLARDGGHPGFQWVAMRGRKGIGGPWDRYRTVVVSRQNDPNVLTRDGMATVVSLGGDHLLCVSEGVKPGAGNANVVVGIESRDGGRTWNYPGRRILYACRVDASTGLRYNAYAPFAVLIGDSVCVAFCTDEDETGPPDASHDAVHVRRSHVKAIRASAPWRRWDGPETIWSGNSNNYIPALFQRRTGEVLATVHLFDGHDMILAKPAAGQPPPP